MFSLRACPQGRSGGSSHFLLLFPGCFNSLGPGAATKLPRFRLIGKLARMYRPIRRDRILFPAKCRPDRLFRRLWRRSGSWLPAVVSLECAKGKFRLRAPARPISVVGRAIRGRRAEVGAPSQQLKNRDRHSPIPDQCGPSPRGEENARLGTADDAPQLLMNTAHTAVYISPRQSEKRS
jgi:hypothetical protein